MKELKDRILKEGRVLPGNILKVDGFLNHLLDIRLLLMTVKIFLMPDSTEGVEDSTDETDAPAS